MNFLNWSKFDERMRCRAIEELLRFMALFVSTAAMVCFVATLIKGGDMLFPLVFLTFMLILTGCWQYVKRKNERRWGKANPAKREVFRIGMTQPTAEERMGIKPEPEKKKKKKKPAKKGNFKR